MRTFLSAVAGMLTAILLLVGVALGVSVFMTAKPDIEDHSWLVIRLDGALLEYDPPAVVGSRLLGAEPETLQRVLDNLEKARVDERIDGVIIQLSAGMSAGYAKIQEIREALTAFQEAGKKAIGYADSLDEHSYLLLAACDEIVAPPSAYIGFTGFAFETTHLKKALDELGIRPNMHRIADYKSAVELLTREDMSEPARENRQWLLDDLWESYVEALGHDRGMGEQKIRQLMTRAVFSADRAQRQGLIDRIEYWDELESRLRGETEKLNQVGQERYAAVEAEDLGLGGDKTIAVVHAQGIIGGRVNGVNPLLGITMGSESVSSELRRVRKDEDVAAVVFRVDSRGGDALTSDLIAREVELTAAAKPVVVSMVDVAASGGYLISFRASRLVADPLSFTGSIGSISGKLNLAGLYEELGVTHDAVTRGPMALMNSSVHDFTPEQRKHFEEDHWEGFNSWLLSVAQQRGMSFEEAEKLAHGRVWTGRQALENGLIDELGGLDHAVGLAKQLAGIDEGEPVTRVHYPEARGLLATLLEDEEPGASAVDAFLYRFAHGPLRRAWAAIVTQPELLGSGLTP